MTAKTKTERCEDCFGTGVKGGITQTKRPEKCPACKGKGTVKVAE
jgi:DnaJ-class molecular chaperone